MKKRRPGGAAREDDRLKRDSGEHNLVAQLPSRNPAAFTSWSAWRDPDLDIDRPTCQRLDISAEQLTQKRQLVLWQEPSS